MKNTQIIQHITPSTDATIIYQYNYGPLNQIEFATFFTDKDGHILGGDFDPNEYCVAKFTLRYH